MTDILRLKVESALLEGEAHRLRLVSGTGKLMPFLPLASGSLEGLADETVSYLDQFIYRFTKLQDAMGTRLFPALVCMITGSDAPRPFLDILNQLEKVGIISSSETWQTLRALRNNLAHEYPDSSEQCVATLNMLFVEWHKLEAMFLAARVYYEKNYCHCSPANSRNQQVVALGANRMDLNRKAPYLPMITVTDSVSAVNIHAEQYCDWPQFHAMQGVDAVVHMVALLHIVNPSPAMREKYEGVNIGVQRRWSRLELRRV